MAIIHQVDAAGNFAEIDVKAAARAKRSPGPKPALTPAQDRALAILYVTTGVSMRQLAADNKLTFAQIRCALRRAQTRNR